MAVIWLVATTTMVAGGVRAARHRAHAAADGAALAAAARAAEGSAVACRIAAAVATGTGARLTACTLQAYQGRSRREGAARVGPRDDAVQDAIARDGTARDGTARDGGQMADVSVVVTYRGVAWLGSLRIPARARAAPATLGP
jgi:hypothetical protein